MQELPSVVRGDAAAEIAVPASGARITELADAYARRVLTRLGRHVVSLDRATIKTAVLSTTDLERHNVNLVGGDPYSGPARSANSICGGRF